MEDVQVNSFREEMTWAGEDIRITRLDGSKWWVEYICGNPRHGGSYKMRRYRAPYHTGQLLMWTQANALIAESWFGRPIHIPGVDDV